MFYSYPATIELSHAQAIGEFPAQHLKLALSIIKKHSSAITAAAMVALLCAIN